MATNVDSFTPQTFENVLERPDGPLAAPQDQDRGQHTAVPVVFVMLQIDPGCGAIVFANRMPRRRIAIASAMIKRQPMPVLLLKARQPWPAEVFCQHSLVEGGHIERYRGIRLGLHLI